MATALKIVPSGGGTPESVGSPESGAFGGWVYHLGVNAIGREYCHLRFLLVRGKYIKMYKGDPHENHGIVRIFSIFLSLYVCVLYMIRSISEVVYEC